MIDQKIDDSELDGYNEIASYLAVIDNTEVFWKYVERVLAARPDLSMTVTLLAYGVFFSYFIWGQIFADFSMKPELNITKVLKVLGKYDKQSVKLFLERLLLQKGEQVVSRYV
jgi:hypothetical protein